MFSQNIRLLSCIKETICLLLYSWQDTIVVLFKKRYMSIIKNLKCSVF